MEMNRDEMVDRRPAFRNILKESLLLAPRNPSYALFVILIWFPFFLSTVFYEILFEKTWSEFEGCLSRYHHHVIFSRYKQVQEHVDDNLFYKYVYSCLLLLFVIHILEMVITVITVNLASKLYCGEGSTSLSIRDMISRPAETKWLNLSSLVSFYLTYLATYVLRSLPTIWFLIGYEIMEGHLLSMIVFALPLLVILQKYLELGASWNMSIVVSLLEDVFGIDAVRLSFFFMNGSRSCGTYLMSVFFVLGTGLKIPLLYLNDPSGTIMLYDLNGDVVIGQTGRDENAKIRGIARAGLFCLSNVMMWVVFVIYYHQCKKWVLEKKNDAVSERSNGASQKIDVESGSKVESNENTDESLGHVEHQHETLVSISTFR